MRLPIHKLDAFTGTVFAGNPAAVCPLERWLDPGLMQKIATENNLAETAFFVPRPGKGTPTAFDIRWFSPVAEVDLCGHATLASAWVLFHRRGLASDGVTFESQSGSLAVTRKRVSGGRVAGEMLELDFPSSPAEPCETPADLVLGLGGKPREALRARDYLAVFETEDEVRALLPKAEALDRLEARGVIATAPAARSSGGAAHDYVLRFFVPHLGVLEDPATGSAHCTLAPYWAKRLGRTRLGARQLSARGAEFECEHRGERVGIAGRVVPFLEGTIEIPG